MPTSLRKKIIGVGVALLLAIAPAVALPVMVHAVDIGDCVSQGSGLDIQNAETTCTAAEGQGDSVTTINDMIVTVVNIFSIIVGIVAVIMIIYGGFKYITSGGDSGNITGAKNTIVYAVIGLVVVALAQFIVQFVLEKVSTST